VDLAVAIVVLGVEVGGEIDLVAGYRFVKHGG
jgi:hypothetical protein